MNFKRQVYQACQKVLVAKRATLTKSIEDVQRSLTSESKSTAGDKHETGRAMLQLEREKLGEQAQQLQQMENLLSRIENNPSQETCVLGSLVETNLGTYYLGISLGQMSVEGKSVFAISLQSPIGKLLFGKKIQDVFIFNGKNILILEIM